MTEPSLIERITRSLAYMLRHKPEQFDLELDPHGYAPIGDLLHALTERLGERIHAEDLEDAVNAGDRRRYEIVDDRVRALYGHSIPIEPGPESQPPEVLFLAIPTRDVAQAQRFGLRGGRRSFLHLALTPEEAIETGRRLARDYTLITVHAAEAYDQGVPFYDRKALFLAEELPTDFLEVGEAFDDGEEPERRGFGNQGGGPRGRGPRRGEGERGPARPPRFEKPAPAYEPVAEEAEAFGAEEELEEAPAGEAGLGASGAAGEESSERRRRRRRGRRGRRDGIEGAVAAGDEGAELEPEAPVSAPARPPQREPERAGWRASREAAPAADTWEQPPARAAARPDSAPRGARPAPEAAPRADWRERGPAAAGPARRSERPLRDEPAEFDERPARPVAPERAPRPERAEAPRSPAEGYGGRPRADAPRERADAGRERSEAPRGRAEFPREREVGAGREPEAPRFERARSDAPRGRDERPARADGGERFGRGDSAPRAGRGSRGEGYEQPEAFAEPVGEPAEERGARFERPQRFERSERPMRGDDRGPRGDDRGPRGDDRGARMDDRGPGRYGEDPRGPRSGPPVTGRIERAEARPAVPSGARPVESPPDEGNFGLGIFEAPAKPSRPKPPEPPASRPAAPRPPPPPPPVDDGFGTGIL